MRATTRHSCCSAAILCAAAVVAALGATAFAPPNVVGTRSITFPGSRSGVVVAYPSSLASSSVDASSVEPADADADAIDDVATTETKKNRKKKRVAILLCPAQFCVPADYADLLRTIKSRHSGVDVVASRVAPLPRTEWIKVARQLPTKDFFDANLSVKKTLDWYFDAMETALAELFAEVGEGNGDDDDDDLLEVCVVGHSIGGWVARAYLGGLSGSSTSVYRLAKERITSLVTLGTPHTSPDSALVDQTRGLLREIASSPSCSSRSLSEEGVVKVRITCVGGSGLTGKLITTNVEELIAATSYLPLVGRLGSDVRGDGIVPSELAYMEEPARRVEVERCDETGGAVRHAHVLPTPWNLVDGSAPSIGLPEDVVWYGSPGVLGQWLDYIG